MALKEESAFNLIRPGLFMLTHKISQGTISAFLLFHGLKDLLYYGVADISLSWLGL